MLVKVGPVRLRNAFVHAESMVHPTENEALRELEAKVGGRFGLDSGNGRSFSRCERVPAPMAKSTCKFSWTWSGKVVAASGRSRGLPESPTSAGGAPLFTDRRTRIQRRGRNDWAFIALAPPQVLLHLTDKAVVLRARGWRAARFISFGPSALPAD